MSFLSMFHFLGCSNSLIFLVVVIHKGWIKQKTKKNLLSFWFAMCGVKEFKCQALHFANHKPWGTQYLCILGNT